MTRTLQRTTKVRAVVLGCPRLIRRPGWWERLSRAVGLGPWDEQQKDPWVLQVEKAAMQNPERKELASFQKRRKCM